MNSTTPPVPSDIGSRDNTDTDALFSTMYSELHRLAQRQIARQWHPINMGVTTLLHEAYLNIADRTKASFEDAARFMGYAARVMRGLIIDHARNRSAGKRGGSLDIVPLTLDSPERIVNVKELTTISDALEDLAQVDSELATVVDLKFFCGFSFAEIAAMQSLSERTVQRKWEKARIYLHQAIGGELAN